MAHVFMVGHQCFSGKQVFLKPKTVREWLFFKKTIAVFAVEFKKTPAVTIAQKINCEC